MSLLKKLLFRLNFCLLLALVLTQSLSGQDSPYFTISADEGLPSNYVYRIIQDYRGQIWIATLDGLAKYDGHTITSFTVPDGLPNNDVFELTEDYQHRIWMFNDDNVITYIREDSIVQLPSNTIKRNFIDHITRDSVLIYNGGEILNIDCNDSIIRSDGLQFKSKIASHFLGLPKNDSIGIAFMKEQGKTISRIVNSENVRFGYLIQDNNRIIVQSKDSTKRKYFVLDEDSDWDIDRPIGYYDIRTKKFQIFNGRSIYVIDSTLAIDSFLVDFPEEIIINTIFKDKLSNYWIASKSGVQFISSNVINNNIHRDNTTVNQDVSRILRYNDQLIYMFTDGNFYFKTNEGLEIFHSVSGSAKIEPIYDAQIRGNRLLYAYKDEGINYIDLNEYKGQKLNSKILNTEAFNKIEINPSYGYSSNYKYLNTTKQFIIESDELITTMTRIGLVNLNLQKKEKKYYGSHFGFYFDQNSEKIIQTAKNGIVQIKNASIDTIYRDIPKSHYLKILDNKSTFISNLFLQSWICRDSLCKEQEALAGFKIKKIFFEGKDLWIHHHDGILRTNYNLENNHITINQNFPINKLLGSNEVNDFLLEGNNLIVATNKGVYTIKNYRNFKLENHPIDFYIKGVRTESNNYLSLDETKIPFNDRSIEIEFQSFSYQPNNKVTFYYQLKGADKTPKTTQARSIRYPKLTPGEYNFTISAKDALGNNSRVESLTFCVNRPWWRSYYFVGLCIVIGFLTMMFLYKRRGKKLKDRSALQQQFAELELNALQSQMNPHFVFNAMGSLQNLVQNNQLEVADMYIAKFARLMRMFLEGSKHKFVTIQEEIDIVLAYFELEKLRFQEKISLVYENELDILDMQQQIPANLLQPFIENAINHGIFHKNSNGIIRVQLNKLDEGIIINIIDNGVGRKRAQAIKNDQSHHHISRAIEILDDKIKAIQKLDNINIHYTILDLYEDEKPSGTKICIVINNMET